MKTPRVVLAPSELLRTECIDVDMDTSRELVPFFIEAWHQNPNGVGIAAPQIGFGARMFIWDAGRDTRKGRFGSPEIVINPTLEPPVHDEMVEEPEGCLSCPGKSALIARHPDITVEYTSEEGKLVKRSLSGWEARVFQHEMDHLDGKLITDHIKY